MDQQALQKAVSDRVWQATRQQDRPGKFQGLQNPMPESAHAWLRSAATQFGADEHQQEEFATTGLLALDALHVIMICQSEEPVPLWLAFGCLAAPDALHPEVWREALLRINDVAMAMNGISLSTEENGTTMLTRRLSPDGVGSPDELAAVMNDFNSLSSSLVDLTLALGQQHFQETSAGQEAPPIPEWVADWQQKTASRTDALARQAIKTEWHYPLIREALSHLRLSGDQALLEGCFCQLRFPERLMAITADGDRRHLLISTPLNLDTTPGAGQLHYLQANGELYVLTNCSLSLCGETINLVSRWDTQGLNGEDFASWLADFMTLSVAFDRRHQTAT